MTVALLKVKTAILSHFHLIREVMENTIQKYMLHYQKRTQRRSYQKLKSSLTVNPVRSGIYHTRRQNLPPYLKGGIMTENEFLLFDREVKIRSVIEQYGEENFYISFSGGKDSTVLSALIDMALPDNRIPRVYANTGIELNMVRDFVLKKQKEDDRIVVIKPTMPIREMLERDGYPFKSKKHANFVKLYQKFGTTENHAGLEHYLHVSNDGINWKPQNSCPKCLKYQFQPDFNLKISDMCCMNLKEKPLAKWQKENNKPYSILGIMREEGGRRSKSNCLAFTGGKFKAFQPLVAVTKEWEEWFIKEHNIDICDLYKEPYNFPRTGCKGCPFALHLQHELDTLKKFFPNERKQCEIIWKPVYEEYRRLGYRLKKGEENGQNY